MGSVQRLMVRAKRIVRDDFVFSLLKSSSWLVSSQLATAALGLVQVALLSRLLGKDRYGLLVLIMAAALTLRQLLGVRVWEWATKEFSGALELRDAPRGAIAVKTGLAISLAINVLALALIAATATLLTRHFLKGQVPAWLIVLYGLTFVGSWAHDTCFSVLRSAQRYRYLAMQTVAMTVLRLAVACGVVFLWDDLVTLIVASVVFELVGGLWIFAKTLRVFRESFGSSLLVVETTSVWQSIRTHRRFLALSSAVDTVKLLVTRADVLLLGYLTAPAEVASYQAAWNFVDGINRLTSPLSLIVFSDMARSAARGDGPRFMALVRKTWLLGAFAGGALSAFLFIAARPLVKLVYGDGFASATDALRGLALAPIWLSVIWMQPAFAGAGKPEWGLEVTVIFSVVKLATLFILVPKYGAVGVAIAYSLSCVIISLLAPWYVARLHRHVTSSSFMTQQLKGATP